MKCMIRVVGMITCAGLIGCSPDLRTSPFVATHTSQIIGRVTDSGGAELDSVTIFVRFPARSGFGYAGTPVVTNGVGEFRYDVQRMSAPPMVPETDTVTVDVMGQVRKRAYQNMDGSFPVIETKALLTFVENGQVSRITRADLRITVMK